MLRRFLIAGAIAAIFVMLCDQVLAPIHRRGRAQAVLAPINAVGRLIAIPGLIVAQNLGFYDTHNPCLGSTGVSAATAFLMFGAGFALLSMLWNHGQRPTTDADPIPINSSRRAFLRHGVRGATLAGGAFVGYSTYCLPRAFELTRHRIAIQGLPPALDGLRIVQLSDIHHGIWMTLGQIRQMVRIANEQQPDLIALTGDYVLRSPDYIEPAIAELAGLRGKIGVVGVLGNHDWWESGPRSVAAFARAGIPLIDNSRVFVTLQRRLVRHADEGLCVAGVGDLWAHVSDIRAALADVPPDMPRLMLSHNPDVAENPLIATRTCRVDLMLSGHTHGGQCRVPLLGTPFTGSRYGTRYLKGLAEGPGCKVYTSRGLGTAVMPVRVGVPPEMPVIELVRA